MKTETVRIWRHEFPLDEFCRRLGIPEADAPDLLMVYAGPVGVSVQFVRRVSSSESLQWCRSWWTARGFCRKLGLPGKWGSHLVSGGPELGRKTIRLRFVAS